MVTPMSLLDPRRRGFLKHMGAFAGGLLTTQTGVHGLASRGTMARGAAPAPSAGPRRIVFFLQNQGFYPEHCRPASVTIRPEEESRIDGVLEARLAGGEFPEHLAPLAHLADRMTIVQGLNGKHAQPFHSAGYGALSGTSLNSATIAAAETIDCALAHALPAPFPMLGFGWGALDKMQRAPIGYCSSAWGRLKPAPLYCNPLMAHLDLFGAGASAESRRRFDGDTRALELVHHDVMRLHRQLSESEVEQFQPFVEGFDALGRQRRQLVAMADVLTQHAPPVTPQYTAPRTDLDWKEAGFEVATAALCAGLTNVVTIASGMCDSTNHGPFESLGIEHAGHGLGHSEADNPDWIKVHTYNSRLLAKLVARLEAMPEGDGTMMDNTLIVYTSCHAEKQHSTGNRWPFVLIGGLGGQLRTGRYLHYPLHTKSRSQGRSINALYATLLHAVGRPRDVFNLEGVIKDVDRPGPMEELLA